MPPDPPEVGLCLGCLVKIDLVGDVAVCEECAQQLEEMTPEIRMERVAEIFRNQQLQALAKVGTELIKRLSSVMNEAKHRK